MKYLASAIVGLIALSSFKTASADLVGVYWPAFTEPPGSSLGLNASTILNLAVFQTLRRAPYPNPQKLDFGDGQIMWSEQPLGDQPPFDVARMTNNQMVLTGAAFPFGNGAIVTARLYVTALTEKDRERQTWNLRFESTAGRPPVELTLDVLPERAFEFRSIPLQGADLSAYSSPALLEVHSDGAGGPVIGRVENGLKAVTQDGPVAHVKTYAGLDGYLVLPKMTPEVNAMASFTGAIVRVLRADWAGAGQLFGKLSEASTPTSSFVDAQLLSAYCLEQQGQSGREFVERAVVLRPSAPRVVKYRIMVLASDLARRMKAGDQGGANALLADLTSAVGRAVQILGREDEWTGRAQNVLNYFRARFVPRADARN